MSFSRWHICCLLSLVLGVVSVDPVLLEQNSFNKLTTGQKHLLHWAFGSSTELVDQAVRLTPDRQSRRGWLWNLVPLEVSNWQVNFSFRVFGAGRSLFGDGFAMWYSRIPGVEGPVFGNMDKFNGLGIFFDTYKNTEVRTTHEFPYVSAMVNNGSLSFEHDMDGTHGGIGHGHVGCHAFFRSYGDDSRAHNVRVTYQEKRITLAIQLAHHGWRECFSMANITLPPSGHLGFSASTGHLTDNHDIMEVRTFSLSGTSPHSDTSSSGGMGHTKPGSSAEEQPPLFRHKTQDAEDTVTMKQLLAVLQEQGQRFQAEYIAQLREVESRVVQDFEDRIARLERGFLYKTESLKEDKTRLEQEVKSLSSRVSSWILPFALLVVVIGAVALWMQRKYTDLRKSHLL